MIRFIFLLLVLGGPAAAQVARVTSGEHPGFSRLVVSYPKAEQWSLHRTGDGYALDAGRGTTRYDLSTVFQRIPRDRLAAIWADPDTGGLHLGLGCECHAIAFDLRPGLIVIDLRDGPAPPGSPFEGQAEAGLPPISTPLARRPVARPGADAAPGNASAYNWLAVRNDTVQPEPAPLEHPARELADTSDVRDAILRQLARGASQGVVEMALPHRPEAAPGPPGSLGQVSVHGENPLAIRPGDTPPDAMTRQGAACVPDDALALQDWGDERPVAEALGEYTAGLTGEFDRPDPAAVTRAVRYLLFLGFGAEARQTVQTFAPEAPDRKVWDALAHLLDGEGDPAHVFAGMDVCDGAAALWAVLALPALPAGAAVQRRAMLRSFSALPSHLRFAIGPTLAERFLSAGDESAAIAVRDAIRRAPGDAGPAATLMDAKIEAETTGALPQEVESLRAAPGETGVTATLLAVERLVATGAPSDPGLATEVEALLREYAGSDQEQGLRRAAAQMRAVSDNFAGAFAIADAETVPQIWSLLASRGGDGAVLSTAVAASPPVDLPPDTRRAIARRLIELGLPDPALGWLDTRDGSSPEDRRMAARAHLERADGRTALRLLAGDDSPEAAPLRASALLQVRDPAAGTAYAALADGEGVQRAGVTLGDWAAVADAATGPWATAAALALPEPPAVAAGPLARGQDLVSRSTAARAALTAILAQTAPTP